jgi:exopolysaccharide biosynthesis WecB/TagA/CpsF family protein
MASDCQGNRSRTAEPKFMMSANGYVISLYRRDAEFRRLVDTASAIDADGMPLVIASRFLASSPLPERVATTDFFHVAARRAEQLKLSFYMLGCSEDDNRRAVAAVKDTYPRLRIAGRHHGFFAPSEERALGGRDRRLEHRCAVGRDGRSARASIHRAQPLAPEGVTWIKSCGGLFKFLSGPERRAPMWMQAVCLEWLFRMALDPYRMLPRYFRTNGHAMYLMWVHRAQARALATPIRDGATAHGE